MIIIKGTSWCLLWERERSKKRNTENVELALQAAKEIAGDVMGISRGNASPLRVEGKLQRKINLVALQMWVNGLAKGGLRNARLSLEGDLGEIQLSTT